MKLTKIEIPRYQQIAIDLASKIVNGEYRVGEKIYARSAIASQYKVSAETARRAICVLDDLHIVNSQLGSGVVITSVENAERFINQYNKRETLDIIKKKLRKSIDRQKDNFEEISTLLSELTDAAEHLKATNPLAPFQIEITAACTFVGKSYAELQFWQHTGATVIAVRRKNTMIKSPGPYIEIEAGDVVYFISQDDTLNRTYSFLYPTD